MDGHHKFEGLLRMIHLVVCFIVTTGFLSVGGIIAYSVYTTLGSVPLHTSTLWTIAAFLCIFTGFWLISLISNL